MNFKPSRSEEDLTGISMLNTPAKKPEKAFVPNVETFDFQELVLPGKVSSKPYRCSL